MAIIDFLSMIDAYGYRFNFYINSKKTYNTYLTLTFSLITYVLFLFVLYFQQQDFLHKTNPNTSYFKQDLKKKDIHILNNRLFPIYVDFSIYSYKQNIVKHLNAKINLETVIHKRGLKYAFRDKLSLTQCNSDDISYLKNNLADPDDFNNPAEKFYCLEGYDFDKLSKYRFDKFDFNLSLEFKKCKSEDAIKDCIYDEEFNKIINKEGVNIGVTFLSAQVDLNSYSDPFKYDVIEFNNNYWSKEARVTLYPTSVVDVGDLFTNESQQTKLTFKKADIKFSEERSNDLYKITFDCKSSVDVHKRQFKTFSSGLASTLAVMKIVVWLFSLVLKFYCKNNINNIFIYDNFDYQEQVVQINNSQVSINTSERESKINLLEKTAIGRSDNKHKKFSFGLCELLKQKVKKCLKVRLTKKEKFYQTVSKNIRRALSVENILKNTYDVKRFKYYVLSNEEFSVLRNLKTVIYSEVNNNESSQNKDLQLTDFSIINADYK
jgi:hypothetical protein